MLAFSTRPHERFAAELRSRFVPSDVAFDALLPAHARVASAAHWTEVRAAIRAAEWIEECGVSTVVDIGSGVGKTCIIAALCGRASFLGMEQRPHLVQIARRLAAEFELSERVRFYEGEVGRSYIPAAQLYYLYNPFGENLAASDRQIDSSIQPSMARFASCTKAVEEHLDHAPFGTLLLTYNGFGGFIPNTYRHLRSDRSLPSTLRLWQKQSSGFANDWHPPEEYSTP